MGLPERVERVEPVRGELRQERLQALRQELSRRQLEGRREAPERLPSGVEPLDRLLRGGLPAGGVVALEGGLGAGTGSLAAQAVARLTAAGQPCAWLSSGALLGAALERLGVRLDRLLVVQPPEEQLGWATQVVARSGLFGLVVVDLPETGWPASMAGRLADAARAGGGTLLLLSTRPAPAALRLGLDCVVMARSLSGSSRPLRRLGLRLERGAGGDRVALWRPRPSSVPVSRWLPESARKERLARLERSQESRPPDGPALAAWDRSADAALADAVTDRAGPRRPEGQLPLFPPEPGSRSSRRQPRRRIESNGSDLKTMSNDVLSKDVFSIDVLSTRNVDEAIGARPVGVASSSASQEGVVVAGSVAGPSLREGG